MKMLKIHVQSTTSLAELIIHYSGSRLLGLWSHYQHLKSSDCAQSLTISKAKLLGLTMYY